MPGIVHPCSIGLNIHRQVGKMANLSLDNIENLAFESLDFAEEVTGTLDEFTLEEFDKYLASERSNTALDNYLSPDSAPSSSSSSPSRDNESEGELPESENAFDLDKLWGIRGSESSSASGSGSGSASGGISGLLSDNYDADNEESTFKPFKQPYSNPFMGLQETSSDAFLGNHGYTLEDQHSQHHSAHNPEFVAWGHTPSSSSDDDDEHLLMLINNSVCEDTDEILPDTPSSYSGTVTGDDSDVDIETITDIPRTADACGYVTQDSSPALSPVSSPSPLQNHAHSNSMSGLHRSSSSPLFSSSYSNGSKPVIRYNSCGVSSSASLVENLTCGRPAISAQKRKVQKERKLSCKNASSLYQPTTYQSTGGSVNFHDYAMSPNSCTSFDTAQPTVVSSNKRLCKRRQLNTLDLSEKEKQHHHNQLERNRRQKLADLFIDLRDEVPNIAHQTKASKVMILNQATSYIEDLQKHEGSQVHQISKELERNQFLKRQKRQLESQLCSVK